MTDTPNLFPTNYSSDYLPYRPALQGQFRERFYRAARELAADEDPTAAEQLIAAEVEWAEQGSQLNFVQRRIYRAAWLLLRDLRKAGWRCRWYEGRLEVAPPDFAAQAKGRIAQAKQDIREAMSEERIARILPYREFIEKVERERSAALARYPILSLVADGAALAADLAIIAQIKDKDERVVRLKQTVQPYLQLVSEGERCSFTGHLLTDIWRYFRFTWTNPAFNTPGRSLSYLVRDAARPNHPVVGIASLANAPLRITIRDRRFGWTVDSFAAEVKQDWRKTEDIDVVQRHFERLRGYIKQGISGIDPTDLCTAEEISHPTPALVRELAMVASRAVEERAEALREWQAYQESEDIDSPPPEQSEYGNISKLAQDALFKRKRASELSRLLRAQMYLDTLLDSENLARDWRRSLTSEDGKFAIGVALIALKNLHVGTGIMELNICGAIPPYNELLGGKLVALLMLSPQVIADYRNRYGAAPSEIASQLKGAPVIRPADLVYIGTTSLYNVGSSQYNRLSLPAGLLKEGGAAVAYKPLGSTSGYGTLHISDLATKSLEEASTDKGYIHVNHIFGEGGSPKLRILRAALDSIFEQFPGAGEASNAMSRHRMSRLVYGVDLASNAITYLQGQAATPDYYFDPAMPPEEGTRKISDFWIERWLDQRISQPEVLARIASFSAEQIRVGRELEGVVKPFKPINDEDKPMSNAEEDPNGMRELVRSLYRGAAACADATDPTQLRHLHVKTDLDAAIVRHVQAGRSVVLTGNPGDGKTHLLRVLAEELQAAGAAVELDASARPNEEIYRSWLSATEKGRPYCIAINEAVLFRLSQQHPAFTPLRDAVKQVTEAVGYGDDQQLPTDNVVVFDLSRRNILASRIVADVISHLTDPTTVADCSGAGEENDFALNRRLLREERMRARLGIIFSHVSKRGYHATMRELQAFISYLLFGNRNCDQLRLTSGNNRYALPQLIYSGEGALFDEVRRTFDPLHVAHPIWDERLVSGETKDEDWLPGCGVDTASIEPGSFASRPGEVPAFEVKKRAFFFYHHSGNQLAPLANGDEQGFGTLLDMVHNQGSKALREVIRRINRFFSPQVSSDYLAVWQSHRYNQEGQRVLYSATRITKNDLEVVLPELRLPMCEGFDLAVDHFLLRLKKNPSVSLLVDYPLYVILSQAERGLPVLLLQENVTRRLWQFLDQLANEHDLEGDELTVTILDSATSEELAVEVNRSRPAYVSVKTRGDQ